MAKKKVDVLQAKQAELAEYSAQFNNAVGVVTTAVQNLNQLNEKISEKIKEIDDYQNELAKTRDGLNATKSKNEQVIKNFNALLCIEEAE